MQIMVSNHQRALLFLHAVLTVSTALIIFTLSLMPPVFLNSGVLANSGPVLHLIAYGFLCFFMCLWIHVAGIVQSPLLYAFLFSSLYGFFIECCQLGFSYRRFEMLDIVINCFAAALAIVPGYAMIRYVPVYRKKPGRVC